MSKADSCDSIGDETLVSASCGLRLRDRVVARIIRMMWGDESDGRGIGIARLGCEEMRVSADQKKPILALAESRLDMFEEEETTWGSKVLAGKSKVV